MPTDDPPCSPSEITAQLADLARVIAAAEAYGTPDFASSIGLRSMLRHRDQLRVELAASMPAADDPAIEAAAKRAYAAECEDRIGEPAWEWLDEGIRAGFRKIARAAQLPPKLCGTCRFWGDKPFYQDERRCRRITDDESSREKARIAEVGFAEALFVCRADFGCVLHEPMEAAPDA